MNRRLFGKSASGFLAGVGALFGVKTAGAERLSTPTVRGRMETMGYWRFPNGEARNVEDLPILTTPKPATRVKITKISSRSMLGRFEFEIQYEITHLTKSGTKVVRRKDVYRGGGAMELNLS